MKLDCNIIYMKCLITFRKTYLKEQYLSIFEYKTRYSDIKRYMVTNGNKNNFAGNNDIYYFHDLYDAITYINKICRNSKEWNVIYKIIEGDTHELDNI